MIVLRGLLSPLLVAVIFGYTALGAQDQSVTPHLEWSIAHEGCDAYKGNELLPVKALRQCFVKAEVDHPAIVASINSMPDPVLLAAVVSAVSAAYTDYHVSDNFEWVLSHEHQFLLFLDLSESGDYESIRKIYYSLQAHNPNARHALSAISDSKIGELINRPRLAVSITDPADVRILETINSLASPQPAQVSSSIVAADFIRTFYGFYNSTIAQLVVKDNNGLELNTRLEPGTVLMMPPIPRLGDVTTIAIDTQSHAPVTCAHCAFGNIAGANNFTLLEGLSSTSTGEIGVNSGGHIEDPVGALESIPSPTEEHYGWYDGLLGVNAIIPSDVTLTTDVPVGIIDSGVDTQERSLQSFFWSTPPALGDQRWTSGAIGFDFVRGTTDPWDEMPNSHGTHVSGLAVGEQIGEWEPTFAGILGHRIKLVELKVATKSGTIDSATVQNAISRGYSKGIRIFNLSLELAIESDMLNAFISSPDRKSDLLLVIAAGNYGAGNRGSDLNEDKAKHSTFRAPDGTALSNVIFVSALDETYKIASFSNYGTRTVEIAAPGKDISSTIQNNQHGLLSGTSQAAPFVTMTAAILKAEMPSWTAAEIHQRIIDTCDWIPELKPNVRDGCRLNIHKAVIKNSDLIELKSGDQIEGEISPTQFPAVSSDTDPQNHEYERIWLQDTGEATIASKLGRFSIQTNSMSPVTITVRQMTQCKGSIDVQKCIIPITSLRDVVFRLRDD